MFIRVSPPVFDAAIVRAPSEEGIGDRGVRAYLGSLPSTLLQEHWSKSMWNWNTAPFSVGIAVGAGEPEGTSDIHEL